MASEAHSLEENLFDCFSKKRLIKNCCFNQSKASGFLELGTGVEPGGFPISKIQNSNVATFKTMPNGLPFTG